MKKITFFSLLVVCSSAVAGISFDGCVKGCIDLYGYTQSTCEERCREASFKSRVQDLLSQMNQPVNKIVPKPAGK